MPNCIRYSSNSYMCESFVRHRQLWGQIWSCIWVCHMVWLPCLLGHRFLFKFFLIVKNFYSFYSKFWKKISEDILLSPFPLSTANCFLCSLQRWLHPPYFPLLCLVFFWFGTIFIASLIRECIDLVEKYRIRGWKVLIFTLRFYNKSLRCLNRKNKNFLFCLLSRKQVFSVAGKI